MPEKILVRKARDDDNDLQVYVPTIEAPKGYIKRWDGTTGYQDVSLDSYKTTRDTDAEQQKRMCTLYVKATGKRDPKVAQRLPRDYQQTASESDFQLKQDGTVFIIEDVKGVFVRAYTSQDIAIRALDRLKTGKPI